MKIPQWLQDLDSKFGLFAKLRDLIIALLDKYIPAPQQDGDKSKNVQMMVYDTSLTVVDTKGFLMRICRGAVAKGTMEVSADATVFQSFVGVLSIAGTPTSIVNKDGDPFMPSMTKKVIGTKARPIEVPINGRTIEIKGSNNKATWEGWCEIAPNWGGITGKVTVTGSVNATVELKATLK